MAYRGPRRSYPAPSFQQRIAQTPRGFYAPQVNTRDQATPSRHPFLDGISNCSGVFGEVERQLVSICSRFPKRQVSQDLSHISCCYASKTKAELAIPLDVHVDFNLKTAGVCVKAVEPAAAENATPKDTHLVRVMLLSGVKPEDDKAKSKLHLSKRLLFLMMKKETGGMTPIGGEYTAADGKTPTDDALRKTAIRAAKEVAGLDLSPCQQWNKMIELWLKREDGTTTHVVYFLPDIWTAFPNGILPCSQVREDSKEVTEEVDEEVECEDDKTKKKTVKKTVTTTKTVQVPVLRPIEIMLSSLLEVETPSEEMMEAGLFADCFDEMLQRDFAIQMQTILEAKKAAAEAEAEEEKKRKRMTDEEAEKSKKQKTEAGDAKMAEETDDKPAEAASAKKDEEKKPKMKIVHTVDQTILAPFQYLDRQSPDHTVSGSLKREIIEGALNRLGQMSKNQVEELLNGVGLRKIAKPNLPVQNVLYYIKLATTTTEVAEEEVVVKPAETKVDASAVATDDGAKTVASSPAKTEPTAAEDLNKLLLKDLKDLCIKRGLSTEGKKAELVARLAKE